MRKTATSKTVQVYKMPRALWAQIKSKAALTGETASAYAVNVLQRHIEKIEKGDKK